MRDNLPTLLQTVERACLREVAIPTQPSAGPAPSSRARWAAGSPAERRRQLQPAPPQQSVRLLAPCLSPETFHWVNERAKELQKRFRCVLITPIGCSAVVPVKENAAGNGEMRNKEIV